MRLDELAKREMRAHGDARPVVSDPRALYYGTPADDHSLVAGADARRGTTLFSDWLQRQPAH